jgi:hypothetical protein
LKEKLTKEPLMITKEFLERETPFLLRKANEGTLNEKTGVSF